MSRKPTADSRSLTDRLNGKSPQDRASLLLAELGRFKQMASKATLNLEQRNARGLVVAASLRMVTNYDEMPLIEIAAASDDVLSRARAKAAVEQARRGLAPVLPAGSHHGSSIVRQDAAFV